MDTQYQVVPWDNVKRWLVVKSKEGKAEGYIVQLHGLGHGNHLCGCKWHETKKWIRGVALPPCKHVKLVLDHVFELADRPSVATRFE